MPFYEHSLNHPAVPGQRLLVAIAAPHCFHPLQQQLWSPSQPTRRSCRFRSVGAQALTCPVGPELLQLMYSILCTSLYTAPHLTISCRPFSKTMSNIHGKEQSRLLHPVQSTQSKILGPGLQRRMLPSSRPTLHHMGQTIDSHVERQPTKLKRKAIRSRQGFVFQKKECKSRKKN